MSHTLSQHHATVEGNLGIFIAGVKRGGAEGRGGEGRMC